MKVANIVSKTKVSVSNNFNVVNTIDDIINGLPTLIVGYQETKNLFPDFDVTNMKVTNSVYWTPSKIEKRSQFEESIDKFIDLIFLDLVKDIKYIFVDPIQYSNRKLWKILRKIYSLNNPISFKYNKMIYIYAENLIFGIDLDLIQYMGGNILKIIEKIKSKSVLLEENKILIEYRNNVGVLSDKIRYLPFIYSITNGQENTNSIVHIPRKSGVVS